MSITDSASITLPEPWPSRVRGGAPHIEMSELPSLPEGLAPGECLILRAANFEPVGLGLFDPEAKVLRTMPAGPEEAFDERFLHRRIHRALELRGRLGLIGEETAFRLINGEGDGLPGFLADVYARHVVLYLLSESLRPHAALVAKVIESELHPKSILSKVRPAGEVQTGKIPFQVEFGTEPPPALVVREDEIAYEVHLTGGINTGLFVDMREARRALRLWFGGKSVLNTFSYTGSFSVLAALEGARSVTSVEFAAGALEWTKTNFRLNGLNPDDDKYRFVRDDVFEFLKKSRRHEKEFDVVILDPPAKTVVPGRRWFLKSDYDRLIAHALKAAAPGALLVVASSCHAVNPDKLDSHIRAAARDSGRRLRLVESIGLPVDFPTQMIHPQSRYLKCSFLLAD